MRASRDSEEVRSWLNINNQQYQQELKEREEREKRLKRIIDKSITNVIDNITIKEPPILSQFHYGAVGIDPIHLVIWYIFKTDYDLKIAEGNGLIEELICLSRKYLEMNGYSKEVLFSIHISFATDEDIQRESGGNYWYYFK